MKYLRAFLMLSLVLGIGACGGPVRVGSPPERAKTSLKTSHGIIITGSRGYCVDLKTSRSSEIGDHIVFGNCAALGRDRSLPEPKKPAILTVSVSPPTRLDFKSSIDALDKIIRTQSGQGIFAQENDNLAVVLDGFLRGELYILSIEESAPPAGLQKLYWRGFMDVQGSIVTLSVRGQKAKPLSTKEGVAALEDLARTIRVANGEARDAARAIVAISKTAEPTPRPKAHNEARGALPESTGIGKTEPTPRPKAHGDGTIYEIGVLRGFF